MSHFNISCQFFFSLYFSPKREDAGRRNFSVQIGNPFYTFSEWQLWNDSGDAGTTNLPQDAPGMFTPGVR